MEYHPTDRPELTKKLTKKYLDDRDKNKYCTPKTQWYFKDWKKYVAVDNRSYDFFMEEFDTLEECFAYLSDDNYFTS